MEEELLRLCLQFGLWTPREVVVIFVVGVLMGMRLEWVRAKRRYRGTK